MASHKISTRRGFTLVELLVVIAVIGIIGGFTAILSLDSWRDFSFHNERDTLLPLLDKARNQAVSNVCFGDPNTTCAVGGKAHGVYFGTPGKYIIFQGIHYDPTHTSLDSAMDEVISSQNPGVTVSGLTEVTFAPLSGDITTAPGGASALTIADTVGHSSVMTFNARGRISWTN